MGRITDIDTDFTELGRMSKREHILGKGNSIGIGKSFLKEDVEDDQIVKTRYSKIRFSKVYKH